MPSFSPLPRLSPQTTNIQISTHRVVAPRSSSFVNIHIRTFSFRTLTTALSQQRPPMATPTSLAFAFVNDNNTASTGRYRQLTRATRVPHRTSEVAPRTLVGIPAVLAAYNGTWELTFKPEMIGLLSISLLPYFSRGAPILPEIQAFATTGRQPSTLVQEQHSRSSNSGGWFTNPTTIEYLGASKPTPPAVTQRHAPGYRCIQHKKSPPAMAVVNGLARPRTSYRQLSNFSIWSSHLTLSYSRRHD
ncbi:hypothetical protein Q7P35_011710 [Cladosporium inversicolor]